MRSRNCKLSIKSCAKAFIRKNEDKIVVEAIHQLGWPRCLRKYLEIKNFKAEVNRKAISIRQDILQKKNDRNKCVLCVFKRLIIET